MPSIGKMLGIFLYMDHGISLGVLLNEDDYVLSLLKSLCSMKIKELMIALSIISDVYYNIIVRRTLNHCLKMRLNIYIEIQWNSFMIKTKKK